MRRASAAIREAWARVTAARLRWTASGFQDREAFMAWTEARAQALDMQRG